MPGYPNLPRSRQLLITFFELYARKNSNAFSVAALLRMMGAIGVDEAGVRSALSRLKRANVLEGRTESGVAKYAIAPSSLEVFSDDAARIHHPKRAELEDGWLIVLFSVPEFEREKRYLLRSELTRLGFGSVLSGTWIAPPHMQEQAVHALRRRGLNHYVKFFRSHYVGNSDLRAEVALWWNLDSLQGLYSEFNTIHEGLLQGWKQRLATSSDRDSEDLTCAAFVDFVPMFTRWRRFPFLDPGIPLRLLPDDWDGLVSEQVFSELFELLAPLAQKYVSHVLEK